MTQQFVIQFRMVEMLLSTGCIYIDVCSALPLKYELIQHPRYIQYYTQV